MSKKCIICGLIKNKSSNESFHRFPQEDSRRKLWCEAINMNVTSKNAAVCSRHFKPNDYYSTANHSKRLHRHAVPVVIQSNSIKCEQSEMNDNTNSNDQNKNEIEDEAMQLFNIYYLSTDQEVFTLSSFSKVILLNPVLHYQNNAANN